MDGANSISSTMTREGLFGIIEVFLWQIHAHNLRLGFFGRFIESERADSGEGAQFED